MPSPAPTGPERWDRRCDARPATLDRVAVARRLACVAPVLALLSAPAGAARAGEDTPWAHTRGPSPGPAHAIGGFSAGCLAGAERLPSSGTGFRVMRPKRGRVFGHPRLVAFIRDLGAAVAAHHLGVLPVGDLSQPRGGPAPSGHASHQTGLDVDLWYARRGGDAVDMVDGDAPSRAWNPQRAELVAMAAADPRVERIFVNPVLKRALCDRTDDHAWLHKVRPWWGHADHFHVRLACPTEDAGCIAQDPIPDGDGCAELDWWLSDAAKAERATERKGYQDRVGARPELPADCDAVLTAVSP